MRAVNFRKLIMAVAFAGCGYVQAAEPYASATVTRVENKVAIGHVRNGQVQQQTAASINDVIRAEQYLLTEAASRAEIQFVDNTIVRVGQNTVFSFDAASRTLSLQKGAMLFYVPHGDGGRIKTPTLTAAIAGCTVAVADRMIAPVYGDLHVSDDIILPAGKSHVVTRGYALVWVSSPRVAAAQNRGSSEVVTSVGNKGVQNLMAQNSYARWGTGEVVSLAVNQNGHADVVTVDIDKVLDGNLSKMKPPLPGLERWDHNAPFPSGVPDLKHFDTMDAILNSNSKAPKPIKQKNDPHVPEPPDKHHPPVTPPQ